MDMEDVFPFFSLAALAGFVLALKALFDARALRTQLAGLTEKFWMLDHRLVRLAEQLERPAAPPAETAPAVEPEISPVPEPVAPTEEAEGEPDVPD